VALALAAVGLGEQSEVSIRRIAWWDEAGPIPAAAAIQRAVQEAVARLSRRGVETVRVDGAIATEAAWLLLSILAADGGADIRRLFAGERPMPGVRKLLAIAGLPRRWRPLIATLARLVGSRIEAEGVLRTGPRTHAEIDGLVADRDALAGRFAAVVAGCDAVVCPVSAVPAMRHGTAARLFLAAAPCLLANLLDPSAVVGRDYQTTIVVTDDGRSIAGIGVKETPTSVTLQTPTEQVTVPLDDIETRVLSLQSLMPENQLAQLDVRSAVDLVAYLRHPTQVPLPGEP
jgi:putative heme-binding domain-containing protein